MPTLPPSSSSPAPQRKKSIDVRTLSLAQLHHFAKRGSRRAKAEIERRMMAADETKKLSAVMRAPDIPAAPAPRAAAPAPARTRAPAAATVPPQRPRPASRSAADGFPSLPQLDEAPAPAPWAAPDAAPAHQGVDLDIGSHAAPARHFTPAPFPSTEMLGELLPLADTSDRPYTPSYSVDVRPEDIPHAAADAGSDLPPRPRTPPAQPFPSTEVLTDARQQAALAAAAQITPPRASAAAPETPPPAFSESRAADAHRHTPRPSSRKPTRPAGVPSRPVPLHIPESKAVPAPSSILDPQQDMLVEQLAATSRQEAARTRADDVPRFIGLVIMVWGVLAALSGIVMLAGGRGLYILASGLAAAGIGWLLFKLRRIALPVHIGALLLFLAWAWSGKSVSALEAFTQSAPLLIPALWMLVPSVREPLQ